MMELPRIQYITHPDEQFEDLSWVHRLHEGGIRWVQLRLKEEDVLRRFPDKHYLAFFHEIADRMRMITDALSMVLTINDAADVALFSRADGLHVGQEDEHPALLNNPKQFLIGGTANTPEEIARFGKELPAYFGVGPLRFTETKKKLKPALGFNGYRELIARMRAEGYHQPVFAIGGIEPEDVAPLMETGVYGIALSGALFRAGHNPETVRTFILELEKHGTETRR